jgi:hypothetical protein
MELGKSYGLQLATGEMASECERRGRLYKGNGKIERIKNSI